MAVKSWKARILLLPSITLTRFFEKIYSVILCKIFNTKKDFPMWEGLEIAQNELAV